MFNVGMLIAGDTGQLDINDAVSNINTFFNNLTNLYNGLIMNAANTTPLITMANEPILFGGANMTYRH
jgi:hypothetical protein